jgi:hypothetical protein
MKTPLPWLARLGLYPAGAPYLSRRGRHEFVTKIIFTNIARDALIGLGKEIQAAMT